MSNSGHQVSIDATNIGLGRSKDDNKKLYRSPSLTVYGSVRELTRDGNGSGADGGSNVGMTKVSDPALKENVVRIGEHPAGFGIYLFDYKAEFCEQHGHGRRFGVMADEVERVIPEAVLIRPDGYRSVNYDLLGITFH